MRITLNLASRPYVELGSIYKRLRLLIAGLAILALPLWFFLHIETQKAKQAQARLDAVEQQLGDLQQQQQSFQADMRQPQNASVLKESQFLNQMFQHKAFSWTAVMMDLENVLPGGVQVLNIDPVISKSGDVTIHLRVSGDRDRAVDLVRNLEHSHRFLSPRLASETAETNVQGGGRGFQPVNTGNGVNFDILAEYNPLPDTNKAKNEAKEKKPEETGGSENTEGAKPEKHKHSSSAIRHARPKAHKAGPR